MTLPVRGTVNPAAYKLADSVEFAGAAERVKLVPATLRPAAAMAFAVAISSWVLALKVIVSMPRAA